MSHSINVSIPDAKLAFVENFFIKHKYIKKSEFCLDGIVEAIKKFDPKYIGDVELVPQKDAEIADCAKTIAEAAEKNGGGIGHKRIPGIIAETFHCKLNTAQDKWNIIKLNLRKYNLEYVNPGVVGVRVQQGPPSPPSNQEHMEA